MSVALFVTVPMIIIMSVIVPGSMVMTMIVIMMA